MFKKNKLIFFTLLFFSISSLPILFNFNKLKFDIVVYSNEWIKTVLTSMLLAIILKFFIDSLEHRSKYKEYIKIIEGFRNEVKEILKLYNSSSKNKLNNHYNKLFVWNNLLQDFLKKEYDLVDQNINLKIINSDVFKRFNILHETKKFDQPLSEEEDAEYINLLETFIKEASLLIKKLK